MSEENRERIIKLEIRMAQLEQVIFREPEKEKEAVETKRVQVDAPKD